jgi:cation diffusion facilitator CzcD-associated flavoprotein CzcO
MTDLRTANGSGSEVSYDVIVVGAGFAGMHALHRLRGIGLAVRVFEAGAGVGGTWFWNRYPGARCDVESVDYSYSFDPELEQEWRWTERYATQAEILSYLNHVADRYDLRRDIQLNTRVLSAVLDEETGRWIVTTDDGRRHTARFCIMASGVLSRIKTPDIPGIERFAGERYHTARWPHEGVDFSGKRVAIIGTGSTGVQAIPVIAEQAEHLYVFQRTPNYSVPARNRLLEDDYIAAVKAGYRERRQAARRSTAGVPGDPPPRSALDFTPEQRLEVYEQGWKVGGGPAILRAFSDLLVSAEANETVAEFVRGKIRKIVRDPEIAESLTPRDHPLGAKRICVDTNYFETYNRDDVTLVDLRKTPIVETREHAIRTTAGSFEIDALVLAIGFDAVTGALTDIDIRGRDGLQLREKWAHGPRSYLGLMMAGFPNLFTVTGPGSPSVAGNVVHHIEQHIELIAGCIEHLDLHEASSIEASPEAESAWVEHVAEIAAGTLFPKANSWFLGANIPGKPRVLLPYVGGAARYREICDGIVSRGYEGFLIETKVLG